MASDAAEAEADPPKDPIASIAGQIARLSTGDRARLRRIYLTQSTQADGVVLGLLHRAGVALDMPDEREPAARDLDGFARWRLVAHVAALLSGTAGARPHQPGRRLGAALEAAGYSETRLLRLTAARGQPLFDQIVRAARVLAQSGQGPIDLWTVFHLAGRDPDRAEAARVRIAQAYYSAAARSEGDTK